MSVAEQISMMQNPGYKKAIFKIAEGQDNEMSYLPSMQLTILKN